MRVGQNPVKAVEKIEQPAAVTVIVICYIPFLAGYYKQSLEVLRKCLSSLHSHTEGDYDLLVFDNGSCAEVRDFLESEQAAERIQYLFLSRRNLGKSAAWNIAFAAAPGEIVAYADSDINFYPGWLQVSLEILETFPKTGMVTAMPILTPEKYSSSTVDCAQQTRSVEIERGHLLAWEDFWRHARSLGNSEDQARRFHNENQAVRLYHEAKAYFVGSAHFQFVAPKTVLMEVLPLPAERPMGRVRILDERINGLGYLRLSTPEWYVEHLGNTLSQEAGVADYKQSVEITGKKGTRRLSSWKPLRKLLQWLYDLIFDLLYRN
jgi:hypothetical protein